MAESHWSRGQRCSTIGDSGVEKVCVCVWQGIIPQDWWVCCRGWSPRPVHPWASPSPHHLPHPLHQTGQRRHDVWRWPQHSFQAGSIRAFISAEDESAGRGGCQTKAQGAKASRSDPHTTKTLWNKKTQPTSQAKGPHKTNEENLINLNGGKSKYRVEKNDRLMLHMQSFDVTDTHWDDQFTVGEFSSFSKMKKRKSLTRKSPSPLHTYDWT